MTPRRTHTASLISLRPLALEWNDPKPTVLPGDVVRAVDPKTGRLRAVLRAHQVLASDRRDGVDIVFELERASDDREAGARDEGEQGSLGLTTKQAALIADVEPETIRRWTRDGKLPFASLPGGRKRIRERDLWALLVPNEAAPPLPRAKVIEDHVQAARAWLRRARRNT